MPNQAAELAILGLLAFAPLVACGSGGHAPNGGAPPAPSAPPPPPATTLTLDLSVTAGGLDLDDEAQSFLDAAGNHLEASSYILVVNDDIAAPLALPVALLDAAPGVTGELQADATWIRSYDVAFGGRKWTTNLSSVANPDNSLDWSLRVTSDSQDASGCCTDFELAAGTSTDGANGTWTVNDIGRSAAALPIFTVNYAVHGKDDKALGFTISNLKPAALRFGGGSTLQYTLKGDAVSVVYLDAADGETRTIGWLRSSQAGSYVGPDGQKICWLGKDQGYADGPCG